MPALPPTVTDRMRAAFLSLVRAVAPQLLYLGVYEYRVVTTQAATNPGDVTWAISGVPADPAILLLLPPLANITIWPGAVWGYSVPTPGSLVRIGFINADPSKPYVAGFGPTAPPVSVSIGSPAAVPVALGPVNDSNFAILGLWLSTHTHTGVTTGPGSSGPPPAPSPPTPPTSAAIVKAL